MVCCKLSESIFITSKIHQIDGTFSAKIHEILISVLTEEWLEFSSGFSSPCQHDQWECSSLKNIQSYANKIIPKLYYVFEVF